MIWSIGGNYFSAMGIRLMRGRTFTERDTKDSPGVVIISDTMARKHWPSEDPIGKRIKPGSKLLEIVGVVSNVRSLGLDRDQVPMIYLPHRQNPRGTMRLVVKTASDPMGLAGAVRKEVYRLDKNQPVAEVATMEEVVRNSIGARRILAALMGSFAVLALVLAGVGIYGVMAYSVVQRRHEIGIRVAMGASRAAILRMILGQGLRLLVIGLAVGLAGAVGLSRVIASQLYGVSALDPLTFCGVVVVLASLALLACYLPARRAVKGNPMDALRYE
jgi:putative ABC transport system permease protein